MELRDEVLEHAPWSRRPRLLASEHSAMMEQRGLLQRLREAVNTRARPQGALQEEAECLRKGKLSMEPQGFLLQLQMEAPPRPSDGFLPAPARVLQMTWRQNPLWKPPQRPPGPPCCPLTQPLTAPLSNPCLRPLPTPQAEQNLQEPLQDTEEHGNPQPQLQCHSSRQLRSKATRVVKRAVDREKGNADKGSSTRRGRGEGGGT